MKNIFTILFLIVVFNSFSQNNGLESGTGGLGNMITGKSIRVNFDANKKLIGSEYLEEKFKLAKIILISKKTTEVKARYNAYAQEFEIQLDNKVLALNPNIIQCIEIENESFEPIKDENSNLLFAKTLVNGDKINLFKKFEAVIKEGKIVPGIQTSEPEDKIIINESYLINNSKSENYIVIKLRKKQILKAVNNDKATIKFIKENKLSYKNEEDVIRVFTFYNTLK